MSHLHVFLPRPVDLLLEDICVGQEVIAILERVVNGRVCRRSVSKLGKHVFLPHKHFDKELENGA